jgi:large subunit ribosomal protein L25
MSLPSLSATAREALGRRAAALIRSEGRVPAILIRPGDTTQHISLDRAEVDAVMPKQPRSVELTLNGVKVTTLVTEVTRHCLEDHIQHIDFQAVNPDSVVKVQVPLNPLAGDCPGVKGGGMLEQMCRVVRVACKLADIPVHIDVDLSKVELDQTVYAESLVLPKGVKLLTPPRTALMSVIKTRTMKKAEGDAEAAAAAEAEGKPAAAPGKPAAGAAAAPAAAKAPAKK